MIKIVCSVIILLNFIAIAQADDSYPLYIEINEVQPATYKIKLRTPPTIPLSNRPSVMMPENCRKILKAPPAHTAMQDYYHCEAGLSGKVISINYPAFKPALSSLIKYNLQSGESRTAVLAPQETEWFVPEAETKSQVAKDYTRLGVYHIWAGMDHLLFLGCLLWIAGRLRRVLITITGFTLAHSVTLALSALKVIHVPVPPVEAVIALSIVFLATEIARGRRDSLTWRYPIAVSSSFGLLHGLGFAAVLEEIGLPQTELLTGLVFFNVGIEIGQILFAGAIMMLIAGTIKISREKLSLTGDVTNHIQTISAYIIGGAASYWLLERCVLFAA